MFEYEILIDLAVWRNLIDRGHGFAQGTPPNQGLDLVLVSVQDGWRL